MLKKSIDNLWREEVESLAGSRGKKLVHIRWGMASCFTDAKVKFMSSKSTAEAFGRRM